MSKTNNHYGFLAIGKTQDSANSFKRYIGLASSRVLAVNPSKKELDELFGYESSTEPEYVVDSDNGKEAKVIFIVRTDPDVNKGIEITNKLQITLRNAPAYNKDQTKVQIIDDYGNHVWMNVEDAKAGKPVLKADGNPGMMDTKYRIACVGECDLIDFLKAYLNINSAFNYVNNTWVKKENAQDYIVKLEHIKNYFSGDFSEIREAIALRPTNKLKLLYGVRTTDEGKQYQAIATRGEMFLRNSSGDKAVAKLEKDLANAKQNGAYSSIDFRVQNLQEWSVEPTNLEQAPQEEAVDEFWNS